jgi:type IV secretion system protein VirB10
MMTILSRFMLKKQEAQPDRVSADNSERIPADDTGIPSVNRKRGQNRAVRWLLMVLFICAACILMVAVNTGKKEKPAKTSSSTDNAISNLPPLVLPPPPVPAAQKPVQPVHSVMPEKPVSSLTASPENIETWESRKRSGNLLVETKSSLPGATSHASAEQNPSATSQTDLGSRLSGTATPRARASHIGDRNFLLAKETALDCVLETAMDSSLPGLVTCRLSRDVWSGNGRVLLMEKGSQLVGEYQGGMRQGQTRLFALWTRVKTPNGVVVSLDSPGADTLGRSGHEGWVDNHFWQRFGAAILMSLVKDSLTVIANNTGGGSNNTNIYSATDGGATRIVEKMLESTVNMPPTLIKNPGESIRVMVARDLDFSGVYGLQVK